MIRFDIETIRVTGYNVITPVVVMNTGAFADTPELDQKETITNENVLVIVR